MMEHHLSWSLLTALLTAFSNIGNADIVIEPRSTATKVGGSAYFNCSTSLQQEIHWFHYPVGSNDRTFVYGYGKFYTPYEGRFELEQNETLYNLIIPSVKLEDAGKYECQDKAGSGDKKSAHLTVLEEGPVCQSNQNIDKIVGPNSCGIEADDLVLSCTIQYRGNEAPLLEWRNLPANDVITIGINAGIKDNYVTLNLTMKSDTSIDGSSYLCQTSKSTTTPYSCNIGPVKIIGQSDTSCKSYVIAIICIIVFILGCAICGFVIWYMHTRSSKAKMENEATQKNSREEIGLLVTEKGLSGEKHTYEELTPKSSKFQKEKKLDPEIVGLQNENHQLQLKVREMEQLQLKVREMEQLQLKLAEMEQRLYNPENMNYLDKSKFLDAIQIVSTNEEKKVICGIAILHPNLFVVFENSKEIEVYDSVTYKPQPKRVIDKMTYPLDITSSKANNCFYIYIFDQVNDESKGEILRISSEGEVTKQWATAGGPGRISTFEYNVIACLSEKSQLYEYSGNGVLLKTVSLSPAAGFRHPWQAIKVTSMHFIVSHSDIGGGLPRVCVVDLDGRVIRESTEKFKFPICLAENSDKFVILADRDNKQILLLNYVLKSVQKLIVSNKTGLKDQPVRLVLDDKGYLFIAENCQRNKGWQGGRISIFATKKT